VSRLSWISALLREGSNDKSRSMAKKRSGFFLKEWGFGVWGLRMTNGERVQVISGEIVVRVCTRPPSVVAQAVPPTGRTVNKYGTFVNSQAL
jgi:hypothetical protein